MAKESASVIIALQARDGVLKFAKTSVFCISFRKAGYRDDFHIVRDDFLR